MAARRPIAIPPLPTRRRPVRHRVDICILAGGLSTRMGTEKARLRLGRRSLLGHIRSAAAATGWPVRILRRDRVPRCGPLGGIWTALVTSQAETTLFLSCDTPFVSAELLRWAAARLRKRDLAVFLCGEEGAGFPLLLRPEALMCVDEQLRKGQLSLQRFAQTVGARKVRVPARWREQLFNINTPADWIAARELWAKRSLRECR